MTCKDEYLKPQARYGKWLLLPDLRGGPRIVCAILKPSDAQTSRDVFGSVSGALAFSSDALQFFH